MTAIRRTLEYTEFLNIDDAFLQHLAAEFPEPNRVGKKTLR
jgi:hypothetical protein